MRHGLLIITLAALLTGCGDRHPKQTATSAHGTDRVPLEASIRRESTLMQQELMDGNLDAFIVHTNPDVVRLMGGPEKIKEAMQPGLQSLVKSIRKTTLGRISEVVDEGERLAAFVPVETEYAMPDGRVLLQSSYRVAASEDGGQTWTFLDCQGQSQQETLIRKMFPRLCQRIPFPPCGQKTL